MNDIPREKLIEIIARYGPALIDEPRRVEGLLNDLCGEYRREIKTLMLAASEKVALELRAAAGSELPPEMLASRLTRRLLDNTPMSAESAAWAVETWAAALGVDLTPAAPAGPDAAATPAPTPPAAAAKPAPAPILPVGARTAAAVPAVPPVEHRPSAQPMLRPPLEKASRTAPSRRAAYTWIGLITGFVILLAVGIALIFAAGLAPAFLVKTNTPANPPATTAPAAATLPAPTTPPTSTAAAPAATAHTATPAQPNRAPTSRYDTYQLKVGLVTDTGGLNDKSFNQSAWAGVQKAAAEFGWDAKFVESKQPTDYEKNIDLFATQNYDVIVTVGFLMGDATALKARQYPKIKFAIIDNAYYPTQGSAACGPTFNDCYDDGGLTNLASLMFQEDEVGFLAGVLAAGMSKSGVVCTVAGLEIPPVQRYVIGFQNGARWMEPAVQTLNVYIPSFIDPAKGKETAQSMIAQKCDVVFGVGGNTGNGGLLAASEKGLMTIGVDVDQYYTYPEVKGALISSAMKNVDVAVYENLKAIRVSSWKAGVFTANITNGGVGLAPYHDWDSKIPPFISNKIKQAADALKVGSLPTGYQP